MGRFQCIANVIYDEAKGRKRPCRNKAQVGRLTCHAHSPDRQRDAVRERKRKRLEHERMCVGLVEKLGKVLECEPAEILSTVELLHAEAMVAREEQEYGDSLNNMEEDL